MALSAPIHIAFHGSWTLELQQDWNDFQAASHVDAVDSIISFMQSRVIVVTFVFQLIHELAKGQTIFWTVFTVSLYILAQVAGTTLKKLVRTYPVVVGVSLNMFLWLVFLVASLWSALSAKTELMQHRVFLTLNAYSLCVMFLPRGHLPVWAWCLLLCPSHFINWIMFHWTVGFCTQHVILFGAMMCITPVFLGALGEKSRWHQFQVSQQLDIERENLVEAQATLQKEKDSSETMCCQLAAEKLASEDLLTKLKAEKQAMEALLHMICDGSFWLSSDGDTVVRSESRFDSIMGVKMLEQSFRNHVPLCERDRLAGAVQAKDSGLNSSVRLLTTTIQQRNTSVNVDLFIVDRRHSLFDVSTDLGYLVGLRLLQDSEPPSNLDPEAHGAEDSRYAAACVRGFMDSHGPRKSDDGSCQKSNASQSGFDWEPASSVFGESRQGVGQASASEVSFSLSMTTINAVVAPTETREVAVQTAHTADGPFIQHASHRPHISQFHRRPPVPHGDRHVVLNTSKRVMKQYKATSQQMVQQMILETMCKMNPQGKGCCFWHIALQVFLRATSEMISHKCDPLTPYDAWQCRHCLVMHSEFSDEEEDSDGTGMCSFCHGPNTAGGEDEAPAQEEYSSANAADNEHD